MNRILLEQMLQTMKKLLKEGKNIGNLKIGALYALGNQLEAVFYFIGHELGSKLGNDFDADKIIDGIIDISNRFHIGEIEIVEDNLPQAVTFTLDGAQSSQHIEPPADTTNVPTGICSFEAGLYAGYVEKITGKHVFAQQLESKIQGDGVDKFMLVFSED